ncbi:unnamed protein product [Brassica oleracea var. botrytis]|uniref:Uncharacterized protein n=3 Tax=Brassica TaxID=3705 RepID=A0A0D3BI82_BRAOL|nr:unnamed protein product [Brassica napus]CDY24413.1 BnaCnng04800D [Brassica napus]VDC97598.1 unnamed protein product [Brassica oleracea]
MELHLLFSQSLVNSSVYMIATKAFSSWNREITVTEDDSVTEITTKNRLKDRLSLVSESVSDH